MKKPTAWVLTAEDDVSIQAVFYRIHFKMEDNMELLNLSEELKNNAYPGRGIVIGKTPDGKQAVTAYFIMGRSSNSRNRAGSKTESGRWKEPAALCDRKSGTLEKFQDIDRNRIL